MGRNLLCANQCTNKCGIQLKLSERKTILEQKKTIDELISDVSQATENFQLDQESLDNKNVKLTVSDVFWRRALFPMCHIHFQYFNSLLDDFLEFYAFEFNN